MIFEGSSMIGGFLFIRNTLFITPMPNPVTSLVQLFKKVKTDHLAISTYACLR